MRSLRLTESRYFSRRSFRSRIYLPVITAWQRRFPGVTRAVTFAYVSLCLSPSFSARPPCIPPGARSCPHYNGITCPHITVAVPPRNTRFSPRSSPLARARACAQTRRVLFFSPRVRPRITPFIPDILIRSDTAVLTGSRTGRGRALSKN